MIFQSDATFFCLPNTLKTTLVQFFYKKLFLLLYFNTFFPEITDINNVDGTDLDVVSKESEPTKPEVRTRLICDLPLRKSHSAYSFIS